MITPFHFACHTEERLRAQFEILDPALGGFVQILRRVSLTEQRAFLQFGAKPKAGEDFVAHVTFAVQLVPQKDEKTALNCALSCPAEKAYKNFRLLLLNPDEAETQLLKVLEFLQKAFLPLGYTTHIPEPPPAPVAPVAVAAAAAATATAKADVEDPVLETHDEAASDVAKRKVEESDEKEEVVALGKNKYVFEKNPPKGQAVKMRTHDGKYVPEGELPAELRVLDGQDVENARAATPAAAPVAATTTPEAPATPPDTSPAAADGTAPAN